MQTWTIKGKTYNRSQLDELKKQGLDPRKDEIVMKFLNGNEETKQETEENEENEPEKTETPNVSSETEASTPVASEAPEETKQETEEEEFQRLKNEKAWLSAGKKDRYNELKEKFTA